VAIPCSTILYRAVLRNTWFDDQTGIKADAFFRRPPTTLKGKHYPGDDDGLSVFLADQITPENCAATFSKCFGIVSLHTGHLQDLGLLVIEDQEDRRKALIINLPFENPGTAEAEKLAGDVAKIARIVTKQKTKSRTAAE